MIQKISSSASPIVWLDVNDPSESELRELADKFALPVEAVHDCLDSAHLPKFDQLTSADFAVVRYYDPAATGRVEFDTVQELTRKTAVFVGKDFLLTVHRREPEFLGKLREGYQAGRIPTKALLPEITRCALTSYEMPLQAAQSAVDAFELHIFNNLASASVLEDMYFLKRKLSVYRRMLRQTLDLLARLPVENYPKNLIHSSRGRGERLFAAADDQVEEIRNLLNTHISLASHRTNEIMRVLTVFSAFFLPLSFIVGIYGMNFQHMPELQWRGGYPMVWGILGITSLGIAVWFRRKGWLR